MNVACALVIENGKLLVARNSEGPEYYLPGGKVESGEKMLDGLARELSEEFPNAEFRLGEFFRWIYAVTPRSGRKAYIEGYFCTFSGNLTPGAEVVDYRWINRRSLCRKTDGTRQFMRHLRLESHL